MRTSRRELGAERNAALLSASIERKQPGFSDYVRDKGARAAAEDLLGITVHVANNVNSDCGVAGSSDASRRTITVARANSARMRFTTLHEIGHVEGAWDIPFQEAIEDSALTKVAVDKNWAEEDACEQFAANLLLPEGTVHNVIESQKLTAAGLWTLRQAVDASLQACAVAWAHQLSATGYVAILDSEGKVQFAARSGDVFPLRRGCDQSDTELWRRVAGSSWRGRGRFAFVGGSLTDEFEIDSVRTTSGVIAVAVSDSPEWPVPFRRPPPGLISDALIDAYCEECATEFQAGSRCNDCSQPRHEACGRCACAVAPTRGARTCTGCNLTLPSHCFATTDRDVCESCS